MGWRSCLWRAPQDGLSVPWTRYPRPPHCVQVFGPLGDLASVRGDHRGGGYAWPAMAFESCGYDGAFLTFRTYGSWLPGDERGWVARDGQGLQAPRPHLKAHCSRAMRQPPMIFPSEMRSFIDSVIREYCQRRGWRVIALSVRSNHVHLLLYANRPALTAMAQIKAAVTTSLRREELVERDRIVFSRGGSCRGCYTPLGFDRIRSYIVFGQDDARRHRGKRRGGEE